MRRFVALAAIGQRRKEGCVGFDQHAVQRYGRGNIANRLGFGEGDIAGEGDQKAEIT